MDQWRNKVAIVTAASTQIGVEICRQLAASHQMIVVGLTPNLDQLNSLGEELREQHEEAQFHAVQCDLYHETDIQSALDYVASEFGGVDLLINIGTVVGDGSKLFLADEEGIESAETLLRTNVLGLISLTKKSVTLMEKGGPGLIINISSTTTATEINSIYAATKASVDSFTAALGQELCVLEKPRIRVSNISAVNVPVNLLLCGVEVDENVTEEDLTEEKLCVGAKDVANAVLYCLSAPEHVQIKDITLGAVRGHF